MKGKIIRLSPYFTQITTFNCFLSPRHFCYIFQHDFIKYLPLFFLLSIHDGKQQQPSLLQQYLDCVPQDHVYFLMKPLSSVQLISKTLESQLANEFCLSFIYSVNLQNDPENLIVGACLERTRSMHSSAEVSLPRNLTVLCLQGRGSRSFLGLRTVV